MDINERKEKLGLKIRQARVAQGLSQRRFALMVGLGQAYLSDVESGQCNIGFENLCKIADGLDINLIELIEGL
ncbi:helix-turn-helix domain-containing protein [Eggerthella sp. HF-4214]|uniref:Helix-turn-helix domain-containing protein n=1 Tax=Eggerthella guodeyinii TaxID=2690837 RepID=A0A6N7RJH4_9ACTN|nr:helix-turn-helix domain-containing protein [Eggerthella guodeyinii]